MDKNQQGNTNTIHSYPRDFYVLIFYFICQDLFSLPPTRSRDTLSSLVTLNKVFHSSQATPLSRATLLSQATLPSRDTLPSSTHKLSLSSKAQSTEMMSRVDTNKMSRTPPEASELDLETKPSGGTSSAACTVS